METVSPATSPISRRAWPLFLIAALLFAAGPAIYALQLRNLTLTTPWYLPILSSVGVLFIIVAVVQRATTFRIIGLVAFCLFCGLEWYVLVFNSKTPVYHGPVVMGRPLPAFTAALADGSSRSEKDLTKGEKTVLVFFRGRW